MTEKKNLINVPKGEKVGTLSNNSPEEAPPPMHTKGSRRPLPHIKRAAVAEEVILNKKGILSLICGVCFRLNFDRMLLDFRLTHIERKAKVLF